MIPWVKYTLLATPALCLILAASMWQWKGWRHVPPALALTLAVLMLPAAYQSKGGDWRAGAAQLAQQAREGEVMIFYSSAPRSWMGRAQYLCLSHNLPNWPWPTAFVDGAVNDAIRSRLEAGKRLWVITPPMDELPGEIVPNARVVQKTWRPSVGAVWELRVEAR
jgi:hypothetical protein